MIRMGLIGLGGISATHIRLYKSMGDRVALQAAAEVDEARLNAVCERESIPQRFTDPLTLIREADIDALTICMPPVRRAELIEAAMERGLPMLCEKPLCTTMEDALRIGHAAKGNKAPLLVNFKMRQGQNFQRIKEMLARPEVGRPITMVCRYALVTDPDIWQPPAWFWDMDTSGGLLIENGGHMIDYLLWVAGPVDSLFAFLEQKTIARRPEPHMRATRTEDNAALILRHAGGCTTMFLNTICYPGNRDASLELATEGGYFFEIHECRHLRVRKGEQIILNAHDEDYGIGDGYTTRHFIDDVILGGRQPFVDYRDGMAALSVALAARESARRNAWVSPEEDGRWTP